MSEIIRYLAFSDWLISLSIMFSRSIHAVWALSAITMDAFIKLISDQMQAIN